MAFSRTGSTDCMMPRRRSMSLIWGCMHACPRWPSSCGRPLQDLDEGLAIIESLEDAGGEGLLDALDGGGLSDGGMSITTSLGALGAGEGGLEGDKEVVLVHGLVLVGGDGDGSKGELHLKY